METLRDLFKQQKESEVFKRAEVLYAEELTHLGSGWNADGY